MRDLVEAAARNNAEWCDLVCRTHGLRGALTDEAWTVPSRSPRLYPDAVTLVPSAPAASFVERIDTSAGCSIKDSFAVLDVDGFTTLFDATWIYRPADRPAGGPDDLRWEPVRDPVGLGAWEAAWSEGESSPSPFRPALLDEADVLVLAGTSGDRVVAGAVANLGASVVGVTNVFSVTGDLDAAWGCLPLVAARFPGVPVVGYERGEELAIAMRHGFEPIGPLRVWIRDAPETG